MEESAGGAGLGNNEGACGLLISDLEVFRVPKIAPEDGAALEAGWLGVEPKRFDAGAAFGVEALSAGLLPPNRLLDCPAPSNRFDVAGWLAGVAAEEPAGLDILDVVAVELLLFCVAPPEFPTLPKRLLFCSCGLFWSPKSPPDAGGGPAGVVDVLLKLKVGFAGVEVPACICCPLVPEAPPNTVLVPVAKLVG